MPFITHLQSDKFSVPVRTVLVVTSARLLDLVLTVPTCMPASRDAQPTVGYLAAVFHASERQRCLKASCRVQHSQTPSALRLRKVQINVVACALCQNGIPAGTPAHVSSHVVQKSTKHWLNVSTAKINVPRSARAPR